MEFIYFYLDVSLQSAEPEPISSHVVGSFTGKKGTRSLHPRLCAFPPKSLVANGWPFYYSSPAAIPSFTTAGRSLRRLELFPDPISIRVSQSDLVSTVVLDTVELFHSV